ncbi:GH3 auxin-responsive promoter family protein [candidate division CSSED10-310 bacterium]|uniref:GH3 auxin-responsive promoter family protein n=1 Tax=candidate division CSSED10-310 bacterium TaxID=2855610 RepID=A0ABV6YYZ5_UNCC1
MPGNLDTAVSDLFLIRLASWLKARLYCADPVRNQEKLLASLLRKNVHTVFGKKHSFSSIRSARQFLERVPSQSYEDLRSGIELLWSGAQDVLFPGQPVCFGLTSGTAGEAKLIPYNKTLLGSSRRTAIEAALLAGLQHGSLGWHHGKTLYIGPRQGIHAAGWTVFKEGTAFAYRQARPLRARFIPKYEALPAPHEPLDFSSFEQLAQKHRVTVVAGNPLDIASFARQTGAIMPAVEIVFNCGYWARDLMYIYGKTFPNAQVIDVYGSNEGTYGLPLSTGLFLLNYRRIFFSFRALRAGAVAIDLGQVSLKTKYHLCVTTPGGFWNYMTGDVVSFVSLRPPVVRLCGRARHMLPLADGWLTENEVVDTYRQFDILGDDYFISPGYNEYILNVNKTGVDALAVDTYLGKVNPQYGRLRESGQLKPLLVRPISSERSSTAKLPRIIPG